MSRAANLQISFADWELMGQRLLLEPLLQAIADFLDDHEEIIERIGGDLRRGLKNADTGRNGLTAQQVLRSLILMRVKNWDYRELRERIADGYTLRQFTEFHCRPVPKHDAFQRAFVRLTPETLMAVNELLVQGAVALGLEDGKTLRVDTTVVQTDVHHPTDNTLLWDVVRVVTRLVGRLADAIKRRIKILWGRWIATGTLAEFGCKRQTLETTMQVIADQPEAASAIRNDLGAIFVSMELSRSSWLITSLSPGSGEKISKHSVPAGDLCALLTQFSALKQKAFKRTGKTFSILVIQEAGLDGFWIHRALEKEGIESHVVDPASIATSRRRRRAKTDRIDGEALLRALLAYKRGEPRVCAMVRAPTPEEEDRRQLCRERKVLIAERVSHVNRIKGLLFGQGVSGYQPLADDRRRRLDELKTGDGRPLPKHLKVQISRELDRLELLLEQIKAVEVERNALLNTQQSVAASPAAMLLKLKGIGPEFTTVLWSEGLFRHFDNRRQVASYAGLAPTPWQSGSIDREQGVSKAGNPRLRATLIELAWLWVRNQPKSALTLWFEQRVTLNGGRHKRKTIVALARKLLVALWKYVSAGVVIEGAVMKTTSR